MRFSPTPRKKPVMTSSALRAWTLTTARGPAAVLTVPAASTLAIWGIFSAASSAAASAAAQRRNPNAPQRGESIRLSVTISFEEAAFGCEKEVSVDRYETCATCHGTGCADGTTPEVCPDCHGTGHGAGAAADAHGRVRHHLSLRATAAARAVSSNIPAPTCRGSGLERKRQHHSGQDPRRHRQWPDHLHPGAGPRRQERRPCRRSAHHHYGPAPRAVPPGGYLRPL